MSLAVLAGCKTEEEKLVEESMELHEEALKILNEHVDKPEEVIRALHAFEAESREKRQAIKKEGLKRMKEMSDKERQNFIEQAKKKHQKNAARFADAVAKYPEGIRHEIKQLIATISRD